MEVPDKIHPLGWLRKQLEADGGTDVIREMIQAFAEVLRRLREIRRRGHLANIELGEVRKYARKVGLDPNTVIQNGKLVFDPAERFSFLHLLNEDLYRGDLTNTTFEAQRKAAAGT